MKDFLNSLGLLRYDIQWNRRENEPQLDKGVFTDTHSIAKDIVSEAKYRPSCDAEESVEEMEAILKDISSRADDIMSIDESDYKMDEFEAFHEGLKERLRSLFVINISVLKDLQSATMVLRTSIDKSNLTKTGVDALGLVAEKLEEAESDLQDAMTGTPFLLTQMREDGWHPATVTFVERLFSGRNPYLTLDPYVSGESHLVYKTQFNDNVKITYDGDTVKIYPPDNVGKFLYITSGKITFTHTDSSLVVVEYTDHKLGDLSEFFDDLLNPTEEEQAVYKMSHGKEYDICWVTDILKTKLKSKSDNKDI